MHQKNWQGTFGVNSSKCYKRMYLSRSSQVRRQCGIPAVAGHFRAKLFRGLLEVWKHSCFFLSHTMKRSNSNSTHPSGTNNNSNNNSNSEAIYTQRNKEKMVTQVTMALKYVHLMEMFEAFIMSFQDVSNRRRIELLRAFNRMGFDSENMRRKVMSRAGLSGRNEYNRPVPKVFEDVIKTAAAWFRRSHPYLAIQVRTKKTGNGRHIHLCFGYRMNAIKGRFNELFVEQNRFSRPYHGYVPIVAILVAKRGRLFIDELRLGDFGGDAMEVTEDYYLRLYDGLLTPSNVHNRRHRKIIRMASDIHDRGGTAWFRKQNWKTGLVRSEGSIH